MLLVLEAELGLRMDPVRRTDAAPLEEAEERPPSTESSSSIFLSKKKKRKEKNMYFFMQILFHLFPHQSLDYISSPVIRLYIVLYFYFMLYCL